MLKVNYGELIVLLIKTGWMKAEDINVLEKAIKEAKKSNQQNVRLGQFLFSINEEEYTIENVKGYDDESLKEILNTKVNNTKKQNNVVNNSKDKLYFINESIVANVERIRDKTQYAICELENKDINDNRNKLVKLREYVAELNNVLCRTVNVGKGYQAKWKDIIFMKEVSKRREEMDSIINMKYNI